MHGAPRVSRYTVGTIGSCRAVNSSSEGGGDTLWPRYYIRRGGVTVRRNPSAQLNPFSQSTSARDVRWYFESIINFNRCWKKKYLILRSIKIYVSFKIEWNLSLIENFLWNLKMGFIEWNSIYWKSNRNFWIR